MFFLICSFKSNAERLKDKLDEKYRNAHITVYEAGDRIYYRVRVGECRDLSRASEYEEALRKDAEKRRIYRVFTVAE